MPLKKNFGSIASQERSGLTQSVQKISGEFLVNLSLMTKNEKT